MMKHCDFCNMVATEDDLAQSDWSVIEGVGLAIELVGSGSGIGYSPDWLVCPECSSYILAENWEGLIKRVMESEGLAGDILYETLLRFTYSKVFNLPDLLPGAIRL